MLVVLALGLLVLAWAMADPPGAPPDESTNYVRALAVGRGEWRGDPPPAPVVRPGVAQVARPKADNRAVALGWLQRTIRLFHVPGALSPEPFRCLPFDTHVPATCLSEPQPPQARGDQAIVSYVGTYQPAGFAAAGLATLGAHDPATALRRGRLANAGLWLGLVALAALMLGHPARPGMSLLGLVVAVAPMAVFLGASVSPNGIEIAAALALWAMVLRLARTERPPRFTWAAIAVSGVLLASTRSLGPGFVVFPAAVFVVLEGRRRAWERFRQGGLAAWVAAAAVVIASAASAAWEAAFQPHSQVRASFVRTWAAPSIQELPEVLRQLVGVFGPLTVPMEQVAYWAWAAVTAIVVVTAMVVGNRRERLAVVLAVVAVPAASVALSTAVLPPTGFGMQGRYVAALAVGVPLLAGEVLVRNRARVAARAAAALIAMAVVPAAAVQLLAWYTNARRYAVGITGRRLFMIDARWSPPAGWWVWASTALLGASLLVGFSTAAVLGELVGPHRSRRRRAHSPRPAEQEPTTSATTSASNAVDREPPPGAAAPST